MNFGDMFPGEKILSITELSPGYDDHASDVWRVQTEKREVIVRASGIADVKHASAFFKSLNVLFGIDPGIVFALEGINTVLSGFDAFRYPRILEKNKFDREYVVVELLPGTILDSFTGLSDEELKQFGRNLAKIHTHKMKYWGNPAGTFRLNLEQVNGHIIWSMKEIVSEFYSENSKIVGYLPQMESILADLAPPEDTSFVLVDIDPSQFLAANGIITGLVDTEAYVIAPRELDFIALEYVVDRRSADLIAEGYKAVLTLPKLEHVRTVYRYLYRLIEIQGEDDIDEWLAQPAVF